jgi:hypothetical protein
MKNSLRTQLVCPVVFLPSKDNPVITWGVCNQVLIISKERPFLTIQFSWTKAEELGYYDPYLGDLCN